MALQQCLSRGRKVVLTNLLPKSSTQFRHLFSARLLDRTHVQNNVNGRLLTYAHQKNSSIVCTKWHCFQTLSCNYSKMDKDREFLKSSVVQDIDDIDDDGDDDDDDDGDDYVDDADQNAISHMERTKIEFQLDKIFDKKEMSSKEWEETIKLMSRVNPFVSARTCDAITMKKCLREENYSLATSYMEHLQRQGCEPNLSTLGNYLQLCGRRVDQCGEDRVLELYRKLMRQVKVLDVRLAKNVILSLTATREWRKALDHLFQLRKMVTSLEDVYSAIITAAFRAGEYELGWQYLADLREQNQIPLDSVFLEWVKQCEVAESKADREAMALTLLRKLESHEMYPSVDVMREITQLFRDGLGWSAHYLKLNRKGVCPACRHQLETKAVSEEEFRNLQEEFVPRVLVRSDIFRSTNPEEWEDFKQYVEERKPFSLVVDGLNASYILNKKGEHFRHKSLEEVVTQALQNESRSRILVLGRQHMQKWMKRMRWNRQRVDFYTLNNMTKDDGFFLYAALQSGLGTKFVTKHQPSSLR
ncbi:mitochondrial ribonuclease P catalytic subunit-like isoform X2 [Portunus trituberculatus]|uniref:mitochondrial ribonuclease P catalytic subunit-like isoform X2 n=1 Tax=Portunus trituberculatus TaxID=210409 RepID=UPI001E1CBA4F|nr:mitochondrial ribonuclease P catalytic subunit-like isoform X2 [Portunus trituberculatus]